MLVWALQHAEFISSMSRMSEVLACELLIAAEALTYANESPSPMVKSLIKLVKHIS